MYVLLPPLLDSLHDKLCNWPLSYGPLNSTISRGNAIRFFCRIAKCWYVQVWSKCGFFASRRKWCYFYSTAMQQEPMTICPQLECHACVSLNIMLWGFFCPSCKRLPLLWFVKIGIIRFTQTCRVCCHLSCR